MSVRAGEILRVTWPVVVLSALGMAFLLSVFSLSTEEGRTAVLGALVAISTSLVTVIVQRLSNKVDRFQKDVDDRDDANNGVENADDV